MRAKGQDTFPYGYIYICIKKCDTNGLSPTSKAGLEEASLKAAGLEEAYLGEANLKKAGLEEACLKEAGLGDARLGEASF